MRPLTVVFITSRPNPLFEWFFDSLARLKSPVPIPVVIVDTLAEERKMDVPNTIHTTPKPTVWQGKHRVTREDWWAASNARNTGICLCRTEWIAFLDDRSVLMEDWLIAVREAMAGNYGVFGAYEKRTGMTVEKGVIQHGGIITGKDSREEYVAAHRRNEAPTKAPGEWCWGCTLALPIEWALAVNGFDETCDGTSAEDTAFGLMLQNNGYDLRYDRRMKIVEDRTPSELGTPMRREDKGISPNDKSHMLVRMTKDRKTALHPINLRQIRSDVLSGKPWPRPWGPTHDFWDNQPISQFR